MPNHSLSPTFNKACHRLTRDVRDHPLLSLGIAVGVGAILGALAGQATTGGRKSWRSAMAAELSDHAHEAGNGALRTSRQARKELQAAANRVAAAVPEVDFDHLARRGRQWLRTKLA